MYKIETHLHTCHSSPCRKVDADTVARLYVQAGSAGTVVADHFFHYTCHPPIAGTAYPYVFSFVK